MEIFVKHVWERRAIHTELSLENKEKPPYRRKNLHVDGIITCDEKSRMKVKYKFILL